MTDRAFTLVLPGELAAGDEPPPDADCAAAYRWARGKGAHAAWGLTLRLVLTADRYSQVNPDLVRLKFRASSSAEGSALLQCGDIAASAPDEDPAKPAIELALGNPAAGPERPELAQYSFSDYGNNEERYSLNPGQSIDFPISVGAPRLMPLTDFTVQFIAEVNGVNQVYELRDGDQPFAIGSFPAGGGYQAPEYRWCPGSPGRLSFTPEGPSQGLPVSSC